MNERAAGTLGAAVGLTVTFALLVVSVLLAARLHHTTASAGLAADAVHEVAEAGPGPSSAVRRAEAVRRLHRLLGPAAHVEWTLGPDGPSVTVEVPTAPVVGLPGRIARSTDARWEQGP